MKEKIKKELKEASYSRINVVPLVVVVAVVVLFAFFLILPSSDKSEAPSKPTPTFDPPKVNENPAIYAGNFLLPAGSTYKIVRREACVTNSTRTKLITWTIHPGKIIFTSSKSEDELIRVWLYGQDGYPTCRRRFDYLQEKGLIF